VLVFLHGGGHGDPRNETWWGQSAGGRAVCAQLASPAAPPLFDKAIVQSAPCGTDLLTRREAYARGQAAAAKLGCGVAACLRGESAEDLVLSHEPRTVLRARFADHLQWLPVTGTPALPRQPLERSGTARQRASR
jgi:para-nitrobenzyl esterase